MTLLVPNHTRSYMPLRGGIAIAGSTARVLGTLGLVLTADGADRWILTAHHVLARSGVPLADDEPVFQPAEGSGQKVALTRGDRADAILDAAAARVLDSVPSVGEILGIGPVAPVGDPEPGMRVIKAGIATGVTEGVIDRVDGDTVRIVVPPGYPSKYELTEVSDSGSVWIEQGAGAPVALHRAGNDTGVEVALATPLPRILDAFGLRVVSARPAPPPPGPGNAERPDALPTDP